MLADRLEQRLSFLKAQGLYRQRCLLPEDKTLLNFSSSDYLGLAQDSRIVQAFQQSFANNPVGSSSSALICGHHQSHQALEQAFAEALQVDACLVFSSGYAANLSLMGFLARYRVHPLIDKAVHASIYDGLRLAGLNFSRYRHQDLPHLALSLEAVATPTAVITEGIFSMSGGISPLGSMAEVIANHQATLLVDEAHAFGVLGPQGLGGVVAAGLSQNQVPLRVIPFGKAMAASGAVIAGQGLWIDALLQEARSLIYSTAISPAMARGLLTNLDCLRAADDRRLELKALINYFRTKAQASSLSWQDSVTPIQQLKLACPHRALAWSKELKRHSILCLPMRQPTVSRSDTGLRVILNAGHRDGDVDRLFDRLQALEQSL